jgi:hypothetical protein
MKQKGNECCNDIDYGGGAETVNEISIIVKILKKLTMLV